MALPLSSKRSLPSQLERASTPVGTRSFERPPLVATESEFSAIFHEHYASLCDFVNSYVRAPDVAEEVVQTVFMKVWDDRASWSPSNGARAYLFAACRNSALDYLRHEEIVRRVAEDRDEAGGRPGVGRWTMLRSPQARLEASEAREHLNAAVAVLPERSRLVVILRWQHELKNREIAEVLGISVKGVEVQFSRALADLRRLLAPKRAAGSREL
jgi:RNA polymerase sigma-70 factor, ECF subfamily